MFYDEEEVLVITRQILLILVLSILSVNAVVKAWTPPVPDNAEPFTCYEFGLPDNNTWTFPDQCFSFSLNVDPFANGLLAGKVAYVTDYIATPTTETLGQYYTGVAQSSINGNNFNPQMYYRGPDDESVAINYTAPILTITPGNTMRFFNSSTSPGPVRILVQGYIADVPTDNHPFTCYEFGLPDNNTWTFPDQCFSFTLGVDPFSGGLMNNHRAVITDFDFAPTTVTSGSYYYGVAQSTTGGNNSNPQVYMRGSAEKTMNTNQGSPLLIISPGNTIRFFNSSTSPGSIRLRVNGYIVSDEAFFD